MSTALTEFIANATDFATDGDYITSTVDNFNLTFNYNNYSISTGSPCNSWTDIQHIFFQLANICFTIAYLSSNTKKGVLFMHSWLIFGLILFCGWAWNVICAPDIFVWNFVFILINIGQIFYTIFQLRPVQFDSELEEIYRNLFEPFKIPRVQFKRMMSSEYAQIMSLHAGEAYAVQNLTRTDRLGLLLSGKANVMISENQYLHPILPCEFLDSPEFESSRNTPDDKFNVSIVAASTCRYIFWQRTALEYLFVKEPYVAIVLTTLVAKDIATKLYSMNSKIFTRKGSHLDIRLPSISSTLTSTGKYKSPIRVKKKEQHALPPQTRYKENNYHGVTNDKNTDTTPLTLTDVPSVEDIRSNDVESWLEISSKYHSCEMVDLD